MVASGCHTLITELVSLLEHLGEHCRCAIFHTSLPLLPGGLLSVGESGQLAFHLQPWSRQRLSLGIPHMSWLAPSSSSCKAVSTTAWPTSLRAVDFCEEWRHPYCLFFNSSCKPCFALSPVLPGLLTFGFLFAHIVILTASSIIFLLLFIIIMIDLQIYLSPPSMLLNFSSTMEALKMDSKS